MPTCHRYATLQVPSNLILRRVGGPLWLGIIVSTWGFCACLFAGMRTHTQVSLQGWGRWGHFWEGLPALRVGR